MSFDDTPPGLGELVDNSPGVFMSTKDKLEEEAEKTFSRPTIGELLKTVTRVRGDNTPLFNTGDWVEIRDTDLVWRLAKIERLEVRVLKYWNDEEQEQNYYFFYTHNGIVGRLLNSDDIRAPKEGLQVIFGSGPWLWQQYAFLRLEAYMRYEKSHLADFDTINIRDVIDMWWKEWLRDPKNGDFDAVYHEQSDTIKDLLFDHLIKEFRLMERIRDDTETWDFSDEYITVYSYLAVLGDGFFTVFLTLLIQISVPVLLVINTIDRGTDTSSDPATINDSPPAIAAFPGGFCLNSFFDEEVPGFILVEKLVLMFVILIYMLKVIPDTLYSFYNVSGLSGTTYARMQSLRNLLYRGYKDGGLQWAGFKLDRWMNTAYLNLLYLAMLLILYLTENVLDIILNALAIDFIHEIDEKLANAAWWDREFRWIKSGTMQMVIQANVDTSTLQSFKKICNEYNISESDIEQESKDKKYLRIQRGLEDAKVAYEDERNADFKETTIGTNLRVETENYTRFGTVENLIAICTRSKSGLFNSFVNYRCWRKWDVLLYLAKLPEESDEHLARYSKLPLADHTPSQTFARRVISDVLTFKEAGGRVRNACGKQKFVYAIANVFAGIIDWLTYVLPVIFPFAVFASLILYVNCR